MGRFDVSADVLDDDIDALRADKIMVMGLSGADGFGEEAATEAAGIGEGFQLR